LWTAILKQNEAWASVACLIVPIALHSFASVQKQRDKFGSMEASHMNLIKELEDENRRLKIMYAEERLKVETAKVIIAKK
jgi:putative transposase